MNPLELADHGPVIPVLVIHRVEDAVPLARALVDGGVRVLEVTLRTPAALACMEAIARAVPEAIVGAGTVRSAADAQAARDAGERAKSVEGAGWPDWLRDCLQDLADLAARVDKGEHPLSRSEWREVVPSMARRIGPGWERAEPSAAADPGGR